MDGVADNPDDPGGHRGRAWAMPEAGFGDAAFDAPLAAGDPSGGFGAPVVDDVDRERQVWDEGRPAPSGAGATLAPPPLPVPLEPMTVSDLLDGAWAILKARPRTVLTITAIIIVPVELLSAVAQHNLTTGFDISTMFVNQPATGRPAPLNLGLFGIAYLASALGALTYFFLGGALARLVSAWYAGADLTAGQAVMASLRKGHIYVGAFLLLLVAKAIAYVPTCGLGLVAVVPLFMLTAPAVMIEDLGPVAAAIRSWKLVARRFWWCVWVWFLSWVIELAVNTMLSSIPTALTRLGLPTTAPYLDPAFAAFAKLVTAPFVVGVCVLLYLDLRVRTEGLDLELDAADAFAGAS